MSTKLTTTLWLLVLICLARPAWSQTAFTLGSTREEVRSVQGAPTDIDRYPALGYEVWSYGLSSVKISTRDGRVIEWANSSGNLKVTLRPGGNVTTAEHFTQGSHKDDVLRLQGTPSDINRYPALGYEVWSYGLSSVKISTRNDRVVEWANNSRNLRVTLRPGGNVTTAEHFTQGSHKDDVLRLQGTPSDINRYPALGFEVWSYGLNSVKISLATGRVVDLTNSGQLKASPPRTVAQRAVKYHHSVGDIRLYYDDDKVYAGIFSMTDPELGDLYGVEQEGVVYFYDRSLRPVDIYAYPSDRGSLTVGTFKGSRSSAWLSDFSSRLTFIDVSGDVSASGTAMRLGKMTFYDLMSTSGNAIHGTSLDFGTIGFDDFYSTAGARLSGSRVPIGNFSFGDWWSSEGTSVGGTTQRIGNILFHSYTGSDGRSYSGTTMEIGDFSFTDITGR